MISVIIPTHNRKERLRIAIESVLAQTWKDLDVWVCDDGSTDGTKEVVEELKKKDERVNYLFCGQNGRPSIPRNKGIQASRGEWLAFLDDDDIWEPIKLQEQMEAVQKYRVQACCTNAVCFRMDSDNTWNFFDRNEELLYGYRKFLGENPVICSSALISRSLLRKCYGFAEEKELKALEDYALWIRVSCYTKFVYVPKKLVRYLDVSDSSIRKSVQANTFELQKKLVMDDFRKWEKSQGLVLRLKNKFSEAGMKIDRIVGKIRAILKRVF